MKIHNSEFLFPLIFQERQLARAAEERNSTPAQTAAEAAYKMLTKKVMITDNSLKILIKRAIVIFLVFFFLHSGLKQFKCNI